MNVFVLFRSKELNERVKWVNNANNANEIANEKESKQFCTDFRNVLLIEHNKQQKKTSSSSINNKTVKRNKRNAQMTVLCIILYVHFFFRFFLRFHSFCNPFLFVPFYFVLENIYYDIYATKTI